MPRTNESDSMDVFDESIGVDERIAYLLRRCNSLVTERDALRERLGCAIEELERRHPLDADPLTAAIVRDGRAALERIQ